VKVLNAEAVRALLPMADCIAAMGPAMAALSAGEVMLPDRLITPLPNGTDYLALMPGAAAGPGVYGAKVVGLHPGNPAEGRPAIQGFVVLFDLVTGEPIAVVDGAAVTSLRTAAVSGLATQHLARPDARTLGILGAGVQAREHLEAIAAVRPITEAVVWARRPEASQALADSARLPFPVRATTNAAEAGSCDIVCAVTGAAEPVLKGAWLREGAHVNLVGAHRPAEREADTEAMTRSRIFVDSRAGAFAESGDLLIPIKEGVLAADPIAAELGEVVAGRAEGRRSPAEITIYKSLGSVAQDLFAAAAVLERAQGIGNVEF
jgi:ornithine cyclodeaminase